VVEMDLLELEVVVVDLPEIHHLMVVMVVQVL
jgi:hypothetical protein